MLSLICCYVVTAFLNLLLKGTPKSMYFKWRGAVSSITRFYFINWKILFFLDFGDLSALWKWMFNYFSKSQLKQSINCRENLEKHSAGNITYKLRNCKIISFSISRLERASYISILPKFQSNRLTIRRENF